MTGRGTGAAPLAEWSTREGGRNIGRSRPTPVQRRWLARGLEQPGGKLPMFDEHGQAISPQTIRSCIRQGWAVPWIRNPIKPDWLVCKLTDTGRMVLLTGRVA